MKFFKKKQTLKISEFVRFFDYKSHCSEQDLNLHGQKGHQPLKLACLPVPPSELITYYTLFKMFLSILLIEISIKNLIYLLSDY